MDIISLTYANIQNALCNFVAPWPHIIHTMFHQNRTERDRQEAM